MNGVPRTLSVRQWVGRLGEDLAAAYLIKHEYEIRARNIHCRYGEMDLIARHGEDWVFVEVKTRRFLSYGLPEEAITAKKWSTLQRVALWYLDQQGEQASSWRLDVIAIQLDQQGKLQELRHHQAASPG